MSSKKSDTKEPEEGSEHESEEKDSLFSEEEKGNLNWTIQSVFLKPFL